MSEPTTESAGAFTEADSEGQEHEQQPDQAFTQADVDRIVTERLKRERDKIGDVKALKAAADELAQIKESQKSEAQKQADRLASLEGEAKQARTEALRLRTAAKFKIGEVDADLFLTGEDEETLTKQAQRLVERDSEHKKQGNFVPREGNNSKTAEGDEREAVRSLFG